MTQLERIKQLEKRIEALEVIIKDNTDFKFVGLGWCKHCQEYNCGAIHIKGIGKAMSEHLQNYNETRM